MLAAIVKTATFAELKDICLTMNLAGTTNPSADKRFEELIRRAFRKKAFWILVNNAIKSLNSIFTNEKIELEHSLISGEKELTLTVQIKTINGKTTAETPLEKMMSQNIIKTYETIELKALIEGACSKIFALFEEADKLYFETCKLEGKKATIEEAINHYLLFIFHSEAFELEEELNESNN